MSRWRRYAALAAFLAVLGIVAAWLWWPAERVVRSRLVGQPMPVLDLPAAVLSSDGVGTRRYAGGRARLVNIFASWCVPCIAEAPQLMALRRAGVRIDGIAVRDTPADLTRFLTRSGNPYAAIGNDPQGRAQIALGSAGVPETFVVDARGRIARQHVGDIRADDVPTLLAAVRAAS